MILHLHTYSTEENHRSCPYCAFQKLKPTRGTTFENDYLTLIAKNLQTVIDGITERLRLINPNNENILVTNIPTRNLKPLGTIMDRINDENDHITIVESILIKNHDVRFSQQGNDLTLDDKRRIIEVDEEIVEAIELENFSHIVFIDDIYDTGDSFQIAKEKLIELGVHENQISLISVLKID